ncbi:2-phospho-L-lactate transferase CofD family protein [Actinocorallia longicatena]|uniref:Gluconeogenesis factor n=1 Tax=Actinocorallia longicatena TaxID=111803 RepID=A0ABP6QAX2_9ACTN
MSVEVAMFSGGRGGASIARHLLGTPGYRLSLVVNGYDNGLSTGALRRFLPGMLGPSDFRKNLLLHLAPGDPRAFLLEHRLPAGATTGDLGALIEEIATSPRAGGPRGFASLDPRFRASVAGDLRLLAGRLHERPGALDLSDCALGNLVFAGAYLRLGGDFNAAVASCARTFGSPVRLLNVTDGGDAYLAALKRDGRLLADEAEIVAPQDAEPITDLFLLRTPIEAWMRSVLKGAPLDRVRGLLAARRAATVPAAATLEALQGADLVVYGPGTPHSSLLPSYLTPGVADALTTGRAVARVFVANTRADHDSQGMTALDLVGRTLAYLGDPGNERRTVTHVLCHGSAPRAAEALGARWIAADLEDPGRPGAHSGAVTVAALAGILGEAALAGAE